MSSKNLLQLSEIAAIDSGFYTYVVKGSDSTQYKAPIKIYDNYFQVGATGNTLNNKINSLSGQITPQIAYVTTGAIFPSQTGQFYPKQGNPSGFLTPINNGVVNFNGPVNINTPAGLQMNSGDIQFGSGIGLNSLAHIFSPDFSKILILNQATGFMIGDWNLLGNIFISGSKITTGLVIRPSDTGQFYPINNPSGFITTGNNYPVSFNNGLNVNGGLNILTNDLNILFGNIINVGSITNENTTNLIDFSAGNFQGIWNVQVGATLNISGNTIATGLVIRPSDTGAFYPRFQNPSGFVTGSIVRPSDTGNFISNKFATVRDTNLFDRLIFDNTQTTIYDYNSGYRMVANNIGTFIYDAGGLIGTSIVSGLYSINSSLGQGYTLNQLNHTFYDFNGRFFNNDGNGLGTFKIFLGDLDGFSNGYQFILDYQNSKSYLYNQNSPSLPVSFGLGNNNPNPNLCLDISGSQNTTQTGYFGFTALTQPQNKLILPGVNQSIEYILVSGATRQIRFAYNSGGINYTGAVNLF